MLPELGTFAIILALCFSVIQSGVFVLTSREKVASVSLAAAVGQFIFLVLGMFLLIASFLNSDMTVVYVREHSNHLLPLIYRVGAAWGGHEGSLLLWCLILSGWTVVFGFLSNRSFVINIIFPKIIMILGLISAGFISFLLFTSNPFKRDFPTQLVSGDDLTPILQDPGLMFHPPMLYLGYVGFAIAFAFALAVLIEGKLESQWAKALRPWVILPWSFLSCGIVLGSWWAYRELGWGGWWFWDPVENASLLPWLAATALIHSLIVTEKSDAFKGWTLLLAIVTFSLSLIGTFLVRSGVLVSVHAFANDPMRGIFLLSYLALLIGGAFFLYGCRIKYFYQTPKFQLFSRETFLLVNSVIFLTAVATILIGTLYPIILDALNIGKISVGEPYFNAVFVPIMLPLLLLMGFAPHVKWQAHSFAAVWKKLHFTILFALIVSFVGPMLFGFPFHILAACGIFLAVWIIFSTAQFVIELIKSQRTVSLKYGAMIVAHLGIAVFVLGVTFNKSYSEERQIKMRVGEAVTLAGYDFTFNHIQETQGSNYRSLLATFSVQKNQQPAQLLFAEQRFYSHDQMLSKTGILANTWRDLYLALGNSFSDGGWAVRIYYKPFVRWVWAGGFLLLLGGMISLLAHIKNHEKKI